MGRSVVFMPCKQWFTRINPLINPMSNPLFKQRYVFKEMQYNLIIKYNFFPLFFVKFLLINFFIAV